MKLVNRALDHGLNVEVTQRVAQSFGIAQREVWSVLVRMAKIELSSKRKANRGVRSMLPINDVAEEDEEGGECVQVSDVPNDKQMIRSVSHLVIRRGCFPMILNE